MLRPLPILMVKCSITNRLVKENAESLASYDLSNQKGHWKEQFCPGGNMDKTNGLFYF